MTLRGVELLTVMHLGAFVLSCLDPSLKNNTEMSYKSVTFCKSKAVEYSLESSICLYLCSAIFNINQWCLNTTGAPEQVSHLDKGTA